MSEKIVPFHAAKLEPTEFIDHSSAKDKVSRLLELNLNIYNVHTHVVGGHQVRTVVLSTAKTPEAKRIDDYDWTDFIIVHTHRHEANNQEAYVLICIAGG